jgi:hypothetical protein
LFTINADDDPGAFRLLYIGVNQTGITTKQKKITYHPEPVGGKLLLRLYVPIAGILSVKLRLLFGYASVTLRLSRAGKSGLKARNYLVVITCVCNEYANIRRRN